MWSVNPPDAPHHLGGAESMVKVTKKSLRYIPTSSLLLLEFEVPDAYQAVAEKLSLPINKVEEDFRQLLQEIFVD